MTKQIKKARIEDVAIGVMDSGILVARLILKDEDESSYIFGDYILDKKCEIGEADRIGSEFGMIFIRECLKISGINSLLDIKGEIIRVKCFPSGKISEIGHAVKDTWFNPEEIHKFLTDKFLAEYNISNPAESLRELGLELQSLEHNYTRASDIVRKLLKEFQKREEITSNKYLDMSYDELTREYRSSTAEITDLYNKKHKVLAICHHFSKSEILSPDCAELIKLIRETLVD